MIVVDAGVLSHLLLGGSLADAAEALLRRDPEWAAPPIWRTELVAVLTRHIKAGRAAPEDGHALLERAAALLCLEPTPDPRDVLDFAVTSGCRAHDCEYVAAAAALGVQLVTSNDEVARRFPGLATRLG